MSPSVLLLLLLLFACSAQDSRFFGTVVTYQPKETHTNGSVTVVLRYKLSYLTCFQTATWNCLRGNCGNLSAATLRGVDREGSGEWCQTEGVLTQRVPSNAPYQLGLSGGYWIENTLQNISLWSAVILVELRTRSDTGRANGSPKTTVLPAVRVPSNCRRDFNLLAFDPDGDEVRCRYGNATLSECLFCTPPSVLSLSSSCLLSFSPTNSSNEGLYGVQLVMEDIPRQTITLTQTDGVQEISTNRSLSKLPILFILQVDPVVPSCTEGLYLPKFLPPTPANRAQIYTPVNQSLEISINAEANVSTISELLFSGPYDMNRTTTGPGQFVLKWTPSADEDGGSRPVCFVVQALHNSTKYHSDLRCLVVTVGNEPSTVSTLRIVVNVSIQNTTSSTPNTTTPVTVSTQNTAVFTQNTTTPVTLSTQSTTTPVTVSTQNTAVSTQNTTVSTQNTTVSNQSTTTPVTVSTHNTTVSTQSTTTPVTVSTQSTTVSTQNTTTPGTVSTQSTTTPVTVSTQSTTVSTQNTTTPVTVSTQSTTTPVTVSTQSTTTPVTVSTQNTTVSTQNTSTPGTVSTQSTTTPVTVSTPQVILGLRVRISTLSALSDDVIRNVVVQQLKEELLRLGMPSNFILRFVRRV